MTEAGSAAAAMPLIHDDRLSCRFWLSDVAQRHTGLPSTPHEVTPSSEILQADVVVLSLTGASWEGAYVERLRAERRPTIQILDTFEPFSHRIAGPFADHVSVVDTLAYREAANVGIDTERLVVIGQPAWETTHWNDHSQRSTVAFISQPIRRLYGERLGYDELSALEMLESARKLRPDLISDILVVPHPADDELTGHEQSVSLQEAFARAGTIISPFSSAMVDALLQGRHVVSLQPFRICEDRCGLSRRGLVPVASDINTLLESFSAIPPATADFRNALSGSARRLGDLIVKAVH